VSLSLLISEDVITSLTLVLHEDIITSLTLVLHEDIITSLTLVLHEDVITSLTLVLHSNHHLYNIRPKAANSIGFHLCRDHFFSMYMLYSLNKAMCSSRKTVVYNKHTYTVFIQT